MVLMLRSHAEADPLAARGSLLRVRWCCSASGHGDAPQRRQSGRGVHVARNGLVLRPLGAKGMPLVSKFSVAFSILIAFIVIRHLPVSGSANARSVDVLRPRRLAGASGDCSWLLQSRSSRSLLIPIGRRHCWPCARQPALTAAHSTWSRVVATFLIRRFHLFVDRSVRSPGPTCWSTISTSSSS